MPPEPILLSLNYGNCRAYGGGYGDGYSAQHVRVGYGVGLYAYHNLEHMSKGSGRGDAEVDQLTLLELIAYGC